MNNRNESGINLKKIALTVLAVYIVLVVGFYFLAGEQLQYRDSRGNLSMPASITEGQYLSCFNSLAPIMLPLHPYEIPRNLEISQDFSGLFSFFLPLLVKTHEGLTLTIQRLLQQKSEESGFHVCHQMLSISFIIKAAHNQIG